MRPVVRQIARQLFVALLCGFPLVLLLMALSLMTGLNAISYVLLPGLAVVGTLSELGILDPAFLHSDWALVYVAAAVAIDSLILGLPALWLWNRLGSRHRYRATKWN